MPDVTISFTDAQWTRVVAASVDIKKEGGDIDATFLSGKLKSLVSSWVEGYEKRVASIDSWE
jgi:hypothetical protein